jgi:hypothetical protein
MTDPGTPNVTVEQAIVALGTNRTTWELRQMAKALSLHPWLNTPEEAARRAAAEWVLRHWREYSQACDKARSKRR